MRVGEILAVVAVILAVSGGAAAAEGPGVAERGTITTQATARGRLFNTMADVVVGVKAHEADVDMTQIALVRDSERLLHHLREQGVERLRTESLLVRPRTVAEAGPAERVVGYDGSVQVSFCVPLEQLGEVAARALNYGSNDLEAIELRPREAEWEAARAAGSGGGADGAVASRRGRAGNRSGIGGDPPDRGRSGAGQQADPSRHARRDDENFDAVADGSGRNGGDGDRIRHG